MKIKTLVFLVLSPIVLLSVIIVLYLRQDVKSNWDSKTIAFIGDSITEQGMFEHKEYPKLVKKELGLSAIENYGVGGSSFCFRNNEYDELYPPLVNRWESIEGADAFFILIGTNDYSSQVPFGKKESLDTSEFNGCLNIVLGGLKEKYPDSLIVVSTILKRKDNEVPVSLTKYNEVLKSKVEEFDLLLFDGYSIEDLDIGSDYEKAITKDRLHPNKNGARILGGAVANYFEGIQN